MQSADHVGATAVQIKNNQANLPTKHAKTNLNTTQNDINNPQKDLISNSYKYDYVQPVLPKKKKSDSKSLC